MFDSFLRGGGFGKSWIEVCFFGVEDVVVVVIVDVRMEW
jgi:hypothetical protein